MGILIYQVRMVMELVDSNLGMSGQMANQSLGFRQDGIVPLPK